ncbi:MAG: MgtC/SapB family protein [Clostridium sp.]|nr:MgtC/SapB family protein [Clostridium sp.]
MKEKTLAQKGAEAGGKMIFEQIPILRDLTFCSILLRTVLAMALSGILGYEREKRHRPAGFRTYLVVCLGSTLAMMVGIYVTMYTGSGDTSRIGAQVISGIGFLGAGTILVTRQNQVRGLTTAAGLWSMACLGLAIGAGFYTGALIGFAAIWASIRFLYIVDRRLYSNLVTLSVTFEKSGDVSRFLSFAKERGCTVEHLEMARTKEAGDSGTILANIALCFKEKVTYAQIVEDYGGLEGVIFLEML